MTIVKVTHNWTDEKGRCYERGDPAAFAVPDAYGAKELGPHHLRCAVCAANAAAYDGDRIVGLFPDDADQLSPEDQAVADAYPMGNRP